MNTTEIKRVGDRFRWLFDLPDGGVVEINRQIYRLTANGESWQLSKPDGTVYDLDARGEPWECDCPDFVWRGKCSDRYRIGCKHIRGVRSLLRQRNAQEIQS